MLAYLGVSKFVLSVVNINGAQELFGGLLVVNELSLRDDTGIQHLVSNEKYIVLTIMAELHCLNIKHCIQLFNVSSFSPLFEVSVLDSAGKTFPADPDSFQHAVTPELVNYQEVLHET